MLLTDPAEIEEMARRIESAPPEAWLGLDTETTGLEPYYGDTITGLSVCLVEGSSALSERPQGFYVPIGHRFGNASEAAVRRLIQALNRTAARQIWHHATFDWSFLDNLDMGFEIPTDSADTQIARWLSDENARKGLKWLAEAYLDEDAGREQRELKALMQPDVKGVMKTKDGPGNYKAVREAFPELPIAEAKAMAKRMAKPRGWGDLTPGEIAEYASLDAVLTAQLADLFGYGMARGQKLAPAFAREMELQPLLYGMERRGVSVSVPKLSEAAKLYQERQDAARADLEAEYGAKYRRRFGNGAELNPGSSQHMQWLLYDELELPVSLRTPGGDPSTDKTALAMLSYHPVAQKVLEYRKWAKARTAYAEPLIDYAVRSIDGRIHSHLRSDGTVTGRFSASGPNLQTIPKPSTLPEIREAFYEVPEGYERLGFDLSSAELWVTAHMTGDPYLIEVLHTPGMDMHKDIAVMTFGEEKYAANEGKLRGLGKNVNYSMAYEAGLGPLTMYCLQAGMPPDEAADTAKKLYDSHQELFGKMHQVSRSLTALAEEQGYLPLHVKGRYRHFRSPGKIIHAYTALNALVQGGIAEYMKDVMLEVQRRGYGELLILQIHDELVFDAPVGMQEEIQQLLTQINTDINPFRFPLRWDGKPWSES